MKKLLTVALALAFLGCESTEGDRLLRMNPQPKFLAYSVSSFWPDGRAMRQPPEGTVSREARESLPLLETKGPDGAWSNTFPAGLKLNEEFVRKGQHRFNIVCANCHGLQGDGRSIPGENMALRPAPSFLTQKLKDRPVGYFVESMAKGYGLMPSFAGVVSPEERWAVAAYIRALQLSQDVSLDEAPADVKQKLLAAPKPGAPAEHKETL